jgi:hypothetical protein
MNPDPWVRIRETGTSRKSRRTGLLARWLIACAASAGVVAGCGGGMSGPTAPAPPANVAGNWSGTTTITVTSGPACLGRQPQTTPAKVTIVQSGAAISGTLDNCSFHGTVNGTAISWTHDPQQANPICQVAYLVPCLVGPGETSFLSVTVPMIDVAGTVSGSQIAASGASTSNVVDPTNGQTMGTIQGTVRLALQRQ